MTTPLQVLEFVTPAFEGDAAGLRVSASGALKSVQGPAAVRQNLLMLLATRPGERVMRPHYGCHLQRLLFEPVDATTAGLAIHYVGEALRRWAPELRILELDAGPAGPGQLLISLSYWAPAAGSDSVQLRLDLRGGAP